jgi:hypothetical protein
MSHVQTANSCIVIPLTTKRRIWTPITVVDAMARILLQMQLSKVAVILATKSEKHTQVYRGLLVEARTWNNASANTMESDWIPREKKDAELKEVFE